MAAGAAGAQLRGTHLSQKVLSVSAGPGDEASRFYTVGVGASTFAQCIVTREHTWIRLQDFAVSATKPQTRFSLAQNFQFPKSLQPLLPASSSLSLFAFGSLRVFFKLLKWLTQFSAVRQQTAPGRVRTSSSTSPTPSATAALFRYVHASKPLPRRCCAFATEQDVGCCTLNLDVHHWLRSSLKVVEPLAP